MMGRLIELGSLSFASIDSSVYIGIEHDAIVMASVSSVVVIVVLLQMNRLIKFCLLLDLIFSLRKKVGHFAWGETICEVFAEFSPFLIRFRSFVPFFNRSRPYFTRFSSFSIRFISYKFQKMSVNHFPLVPNHFYASCALHLLLWSTKAKIRVDKNQLSKFALSLSVPALTVAFFIHSKPLRIHNPIIKQVNNKRETTTS